MGTFSIVVCVDNKFGISKDAKIPWHISEDMYFFRKLTTGCVIIMGRTTFESVGYLPKRTTLVVSSTLQGDNIFKTLQDALDKAYTLNNYVYVVGGASLYMEAYTNKDCDKVYMNVIDYDYMCDNHISCPTEFNFECLNVYTFKVHDTTNDIDVFLSKKIYNGK